MAKDLKLADELTLNVYDIRRTILGETSRTGLPCVMVRLAGCDLRCAWCDSLEATVSSNGRTLTLAEIAAAVDPLGTRVVCIGGGEPLQQKHAPALAAMLAAAGYTVLVETNGAHDISPLRPPIVRVMDVKCPASGMSRSFNWYNLQHLRPEDEVKFVIGGRDDYEYAREVIEKHALSTRCQVLLSPVSGPLAEIAPALLAEWMLWDDLDARLQLPLHKIVWPQGEPQEPRAADGK